MNILSFVIHVHYKFLNTGIKGIQWLLFGKVTPDAQKVLVVRKGNLGDIICSFPAFESLKRYFPKATIDLLTTRGSQSSIGADYVIPKGYVNRIMEFRSFTRHSLFTFLRATRYDVVIELPADVDTFYTQLRNMLFYRLAGIRKGGGWSVTHTRLMPSYQAHHLRFDNEQQRLRAILAKCAIPSTVDSYPALYSQTDMETVQRQYISTTSKPLIVVAVGAKLDKKKWPLEYFKTIIRYLQSEQYAIVAIGDQSDAAAVDSLSLPDVQNACGKLTISESAALLAASVCCICNDSGPMHLSYAVGTPVYAIFSARNYQGKWHPPSGNHVFTNYNVSCAGCMSSPCSSNECMKAITPDQVIQSLKRNLRS